MYLMDGNFGAKSYDSGYNKSIGGTTDNRGWQKNLLEVEQVQDFTPTAYAIQGKWAPVYEYYTKDENGEMIRIGSGKINQETGKMETTISVDGQDRSNDIRYGTEELAKAKEDGQLYNLILVNIQEQVQKHHVKTLNRLLQQKQFKNI